MNNVDIAYKIVAGVLIPIISAFIGGLFTFLGVKLTLKRAKQEKQNEKSRQAMAYLQFDYQIASHASGPLTTINAVSNENPKKIPIRLDIRNLGPSFLILCQLVINDTHINIERYILPALDVVRIDCFTEIENVEKVSIIGETYTGDIYEFDCAIDEKFGNVIVKTIGLPNKISTNEK